MTHILFAGAPGSKWSSVVKHIYWSPSIDQTDYSKEREYWHDADTPGTNQLMHIGAYWDPGMEFEPMDWDTPFSGTGKRIVKSHVFSYQLNRFKDWKPIVMVYRNDVDCLEWWKACGHFNITYPNYEPYYKNLDNMWPEIQKQNRAIMLFVKQNYDKIKQPVDNTELCKLLDIEVPKDTYQNYKDKDIKVYAYV
tara:strand:- start:914 stop:1495 length:582 start_codon:yes stop_codon:yes gene_type:complete